MSKVNVGLDEALYEYILNHLRDYRYARMIKIQKNFYGKFTLKALTQTTFCRYPAFNFN